jgi:hypothetical protein
VGTLGLLGMIPSFLSRQNELEFQERLVEQDAEIADLEARIAPVRG